MGKVSNLSRLARGTYGSGGEVLDKTLYDDCILAAAVLVHRLFVVPLGGGVPAKTLADTNMTTAGMIPQGQNIAVRAIKVWYAGLHQFASADVLNFYAMLANTTVEILLPGKDKLGEWNLQELFGCCVTQAATPAVAGNNEPHLSPRFHGITPLNTPLVLAALTPIEVRIQHHVATAAAIAGDRLYVGLTGTMQRAS